MTRWFQSIAGCGVLLMAIPPVLADPQCKPVVGHFEAVVVPPGQGHCPSNPPVFCTAGRVWGGIQGNYQFVMTGEISSNSGLISNPPSGIPTIQFFVGKSTIFLKKGGDQVDGTDTGSIDVGGQGGFASLIAFTGGTGGMSDATGQIRLRGEFDAQEGATNGDYIGTLCKP